MANTDQ